MSIIDNIYKILCLLTVKYYKWKTLIWYKTFFRKIGKNSMIAKPLKIDNPFNISIDDNVNISKYAWLYTQKIYKNKPSLVIRSGTQIGNFVHIVAIKDVDIGKNVLVADKVYISDNNHEFFRIDIPIMNQGIKFKKKVHIGEGSWIGENVSIIGASIGKNCIIGSNSVVTSDIGDYCIAVGSPAKVIKQYDKNKEEWIKSSN